MSASYDYGHGGRNEASVTGPVLLAIFCHLMFLACFLISPAWRTDRPHSRSAVSVRMVSIKGDSAQSPLAPADTLKPPVASPSADVKAAAPPRETPKKTQTDPAPAEPPKPKTALKQKTFKSTQVVKEAIKRLESTVPAERTVEPAPPASQESLKSTLDRLRREVGKTEAAVPPATPLNTADAGGTIATRGASSGSGDRNGDRTAHLLDVYRIEVAFQVQKHWAFNEQLVGEDPSLMAAIVFKVMPNGNIVDIFFTDRSANTYLNDSAYRAIVKSAPVSPHPKGLNLPYVELGIRFTPQGIR